MFFLALVLGWTPWLHAEEATDIVFADFEGSDYGEWSVIGNAFGDKPASGTIGNQQDVRGFKGKGLVNTFLPNDGPTGTLTSPEFTITRDFIAFLIGGGNHAQTAIQLLIGEDVKMSESGENDEFLLPAFFDVTGFAGKKARLRIIDKETGGWGHVNIDQIVFTNEKPKPMRRPNIWNTGRASAAPHLPSYPGDAAKAYREPWRPQFHFSPRTEWMNDINGLAYHNGVYHMLYQWGKAKRHGGYATSKDLLHWEDKGVALVPQDTFLPKDVVRNISGAEKYSGSAVVVSGETAKKITGSEKPAIIAIYTGTKVGTCLAWTNDEGETWHNYENNPVANPTRGADPRDPCVIWYEPGQKWVLAIYEHGTTFYGSTDLIAWEKLSNINFGFECPDLVDLPLDGDPDNIKWVLYDAAGKYLVGDFDGVNFIDENKSKDAMYMDLGPDFYAGQSFYPYNLPEKKYIQLAWMAEWNGSVGERPWEHNATFPVELGLVTRDGKMCVTRTPLAVIKKLYKGEAVTLSGLTVGRENVLKDVQSKAFDMTLTLDLNDATAEEIVFQVANVSYRYNVKTHQLMYDAIGTNRFGGHQPPILRPDSDGLLKLRVLVDWCSIEIFSDGGVFSFSQQVGFDPKDDRLHLTAKGGDATLVDLTLQQIKSIWK